MRRLILFDIDGTILSTNGAAKRAFQRAMVEVYGTAGPIETHAFAGKTDPQIARELLTLHGLESRRIDAGFASLWQAYVRELEVELAQPGHESRLMPGVAALLDALAERGDMLLGLLTGNIAAGARLKLRSVGLQDRFALGAYGSDSERRDALPAVAVARARELTGHAFRGRDVVVIGDTPYDITCGREMGVTAVGVATGSHDAGDLARAGADAVLQDLADTATTLDILAGAP